MNHTLCISDLDGTLLTPQAALSPFAIESLRKLMQHGLCFTIATARTWQSAGILLRDILPLSAPAVLLNGALVYDTQANQYVKKEIIPPGRVRELLRVMKAHGQTGYLYSIREGFIRPYHEDISTRPLLQAFMAARTGYYTFTRTDDLALHAEEEIVYLTMQDRWEALAGLHDAVKALPKLDCVLYEDSYTPGVWYLECFSRTASKFNAVRWLRGACGYDKIIGFGDNLNDIPLFAACDDAWAVSNAKAELKAAATGVIGSNEEDGVVQFLRFHIRKATIDDAPACAEIHCLGWEAAYADFVPAVYLEQRRPGRLEKWRASLSQPHEIYVPVLDGEVVGFLGLGQPGEHENLPDCYYEVCGIYLHPAVYRQGIGRRLMAFAEEQARAKGKTAMMLWVFEDNAPSRRFYEACGYRPDGAISEHEYGRVLRCLRYGKELKSK
ncbi:MAG: GNAT family N-acetyltransferase [Oscillospiraceae bacterium]|nr:GNAT family N-acetyltransferase [Oscillospiraceae bacterium]